MENLIPFFGVPLKVQVGSVTLKLFRALWLGDYSVFILWGNKFKKGQNMSPVGNSKYLRSVYF